MAHDWYPDKCLNSITVFDMPNDLSGNVQVRTVQLYDEKTAFQIHSTPSNSVDFVIVFLDSNEVVTCEKFIDIIASIDTISLYFESFKNIDQCIDFISSLTHEKVFLILFLTEAEHLISLIHDIPSLASIYICIEREDENIDFEQLNWLNGYPIVRGRVHKLNNELFRRLTHDMKSMQIPLVNSKLFSMKTKQINSVKTLNTEQASYQWNQLLLNALQKLPQNDKSRQDILNECKLQYHDDQSELKKIEQFEKTYQPKSAVWWYTQDSFLYRLINKALQTEDIDIIFKFRFFIIDLYNQLIDLHNQSKSEKPNILTVYRGQQLGTDELENLKLNIDHLISLKPFLSATTNKEVALIYAGNGSERPLMESVVFEIIIDVNKSLKPLADISKISQMSDEEEVLLSMSMLFIVESIEKIDNNVWKIQLTSRNETDIKVNDYHEYLKVNEDDETLMRLAALLIEMKSYDKAEKYLLMLLEEGTNEYPLIYNKLGICYLAKHNYRRALQYFTKALNHYIVSNLDTHPICCNVYNNIAHVYTYNGDYEQALRFHNKALEVHLRYPTRNTNAFVQTLTYMGNIYQFFGNYDECLKKYSHALEIVEKSSLRSHWSAAVLYNYMGNTHLRLGQYDKSMENYKTAFRIHKEISQTNDPSIAHGHICIGEVYECKGEYDEALRHYKQAERIFVSRDVIDHMELATVYSRLGIVYRKKEEYEQALHYQHECLKIQKQFHPENSNVMATVYGSIGVLYNAIHNIEKGIEYTKKAIACIQNCPTPDNSELARLYSNLGSNYIHLGNSEQALHYLNLSLDIKRRFFPENHPTFAVTFNNIAVALARKGDFQMAIDYQEKALKILKDAHGVNHPDYRMCLMDLSGFKILKNYNTDK